MVQLKETGAGLMVAVAEDSKWSSHILPSRLLSSLL